MQIRDDHSVFESSKLADSISGEKVFYTECVCNIDAAFLTNPLKAFIIVLVEFAEAEEPLPP